MQNIQNSLAQKQKTIKAPINSDDEELNALGVRRDQDDLDKERKRKNQSVSNVFNKMNQKIQIESLKKITDSDEEMLGEVENYKEYIGREIEGEMKQKTEEFKKIALKNNNENTEKDTIYTAKAGGLITNMNKKDEKNISDDNTYNNNNVNNKNSNTYFEEIIGNIGQGEFDINKYSEINKVLTRKNEVKWDKRNQNAEVDYTKGGLQTFDKPKGKKEFGLILNSTSNDNDNDDAEEAYFDEEEQENECKGLEGDVYAESLLSRKRDREANANPYLEFAPPKNKIYGAPQKPKSRNIQEEILDENDYEAIYLPQEIYKVEHDINKPSQYKRDYED